MKPVMNSKIDFKCEKWDVCTYHGWMSEPHFHSCPHRSGHQRQFSCEKAACYSWIVKYIEEVINETS